MSNSICARCLWRLQSPRIAPSLQITSAFGRSSFHSSASRYKSIVKKKAVAPGRRTQGPGFRESRAASIKKKKKDRPRPPPPGERKQARMRIVLSNTNALEVQGLEQMTRDNVLQTEKVGEMLAIEGTVIDQLRDVKAFKPSQNWNMFRRPATLIRKETIDLGRDFEDIIQEPKTIQRIITGEPKSGKSIHLLQAMSMAFMNKWVVINVPEAQDYTINHSSYAPTPGGEDEQLYVQPHLASDLLTRAVAANSTILNKLPLAHDHSSSRLTISKGMNLKDLATLGADDASIAWPVWQALWKELNSKGTGKTPIPPVLLAVDSVDHWFGMTQYRSSDFSLIHAHQFLFIRQFMQLLFHTPTPGLANGGMVLATTSGSNSPLVPSFHILLRQMMARAKGLEMTDPDFPLPKPYQKVDQRVLDLFSGSQATQVQELKGVTQKEAKGLLEYFARSGILKEALTDTKISEKWTLSGGGILGELTKFGSRSTLDEESDPGPVASDPAPKDSEYANDMASQKLSDRSHSGQTFYENGFQKENRAAMPKGLRNFLHQRKFQDSNHREAWAQYLQAGAWGSSRDVAEAIMGEARQRSRLVVEEIMLEASGSEDAETRDRNRSRGRSTSFNHTYDPGNPTSSTGISATTRCHATREMPPSFRYNKRISKRDVFVAERRQRKKDRQAELRKAKALEKARAAASKLEAPMSEILEQVPPIEPVTSREPAATTDVHLTKPLASVNAGRASLTASPETQERAENPAPSLNEEDAAECHGQTRTLWWSLKLAGKMLGWSS